MKKLGILLFSFALSIALVVALIFNLRHSIASTDDWDGTLSLVSVSSDGVQGNMTSMSPDISSDGRYIVFVTDSTNLITGTTNAKTRIFLRDRYVGETNVVSIILTES